MCSTSPLLPILKGSQVTDLWHLVMIGLLTLHKDTLMHPVLLIFLWVVIYYRLWLEDHQIFISRIPGGHKLCPLERYTDSSRWPSCVMEQLLGVPKLYCVKICMFKQLFRCCAPSWTINYVNVMENNSLAELTKKWSTWAKLYTIIENFLHW